MIDLNGTPTATAILKELAQREAQLKAAEARLAKATRAAEAAEGRANDIALRIASLRQALCRRGNHESCHPLNACRQTEG